MNAKKPVLQKSTRKKTRAGMEKASSKIAPDKRVELLLEVGCEEIPAGMLPKAISELKTILQKHLTAENLAEGTQVETYGGPRRLTAVIRQVIAKQSDVVNEVTG